MKKITLGFALLLISTSNSLAMGGSKYLIGLGYFAQNSLGHTTTKDSGAASTTGTALYPLIFTYSTSLFGDYNFDPQFQWTPMARTSDTYSSSIMLLNFPVGKSFAGDWQWFSGPGILVNTISGKGGTTVLNNGTSTATFAVPGRSVQTKTVTFDLGMAWNSSSQRVAFGTLMEDFLSTTGKRSYNLYLNWSYALRGGY